jgi:hypothetical protein
MRAGYLVNSTITTNVGLILGEAKNPRYEYHIETFLGFVHLACLVLFLKHLSDAKC